MRWANFVSIPAKRLRACGCDNFFALLDVGLDVAFVEDGSDWLRDDVGNGFVLSDFSPDSEFERPTFLSQPGIIPEKDSLQEGVRGDESGKGSSDGLASVNEAQIIRLSI